MRYWLMLAIAFLAFALLDQFVEYRIHKNLATTPPTLVESAGGGD
jgi:hypothetical protein